MHILWLTCTSISHSLKPLNDSLFKTIWHINSACQLRRGEPAALTLWRLSVSAPLHHWRDWWPAIAKPSLRSCDGHWSGRRVGHQVVASGLRVFLEHTLPVALQAWLAEHLSAMCRPAGRADPQSNHPAKGTSRASECPSGICWVISQSDSFSSVISLFSLQHRTVHRVVAVSKLKLKYARRVSTTYF